MAQEFKAASKRIVLHHAPIELFFEFLGLAIPISLLFLLAAFIVESSMGGDPQILIRLSNIYRALIVLAMLEIARRYFNTLYILGPRRITRICGRLSLRLRRFSITYADVREVKVRQGLLGRIFNYGEVDLETASKDMVELPIASVANPQAVGEYVEKKRADMLKRRRSFGPAVGSGHERSRLVYETIENED